jgi:hypothetical protein
LRGVKICLKRVASSVIALLSIQPKQSASSIASIYVTPGWGLSFLRMMSQTPGESAWRSASHVRQAARMGGAIVSKVALTG